MTINEAIDQINILKANIYTDEEKTEWLSRVDGMIKRIIIDTHEDGEDIDFDGYDENTDPDTELLAPHPYDELYIRWLEAQIDYTNAEYGKYNNAITTFNTVFNNYQNYYNRQHMPKGKKIKCF